MGIRDHRTIREKESGGHCKLRTIRSSGGFRKGGGGGGGGGGGAAPLDRWMQGMKIFF